MSLALLFAHLSTSNLNHSLLSITPFNLLPHNNSKQSQCNKLNILFQICSSKGFRHNLNKEAEPQEEEKYFKQALNLSHHHRLIQMFKLVIIHPLGIPHNHHIFHKSNKIQYLLEALLLNFRITSSFLLRILFFPSLHHLLRSQLREGLQKPILVIKVSIAVIA